MTTGDERTEGERSRTALLDEPAPPVELSVVMPCLNEAETLALCIRKIRRACEANHLAHEIIVADNGSSDDSPAIGRAEGARVVTVEERGYGRALMGGIGAARGRYVVMGDADHSYDFSELPLFVEKLREGYDLVQGCRLARGGGEVLPGAMPALHRWVGNPLFSMLARRWFRVPVSDVYCGMRGITRSHALALGQRCTGMEFATEMLVKSAFASGRIAEVPITLHPDGRSAHAPHLRTVRDGWRTLRYFLLCSPRWLFLMPGLALMCLGAVGYALTLPGLQLLGMRLDAHSLLFSSLALLCGHQSILFAIMTKAFGTAEGVLPADPRLDRLRGLVTLNQALAAAAVVMVAGSALLLLAVNEWRLREFGDLDYAETMRLVVPGVTLVALGYQTMLSSFFISVLGLRRV